MILLEGKVAIVTGGASGIGEAVARTVAGLGGSVVIADIDEARATQVEADIRATGGEATVVVTDIMAEDNICKMVEKTISTYGGIDILHNNAGVPRTIAPECEILELPTEWWNKTLLAHLTSTMLGCKYALPHMIQRGGGAIGNTTSMASWLATVNMPAYGAAKAGVNQITREVAASYGRNNVRCNAVACGPIATARMKATLTPELFKMHADETALPRISEAQDVANLVVFLCSQQARMITGQVIEISGGLSGKLPGWPVLMQGLRGKEFDDSACSYEQVFGQESQNQQL